MTYAPDQCGAQCALCPLNPSSGSPPGLHREGPPVPPALSDDPQFAIVTSWPDRGEPESGYLLSGRLGMLLRSTLLPLGVPLNSVSRHAALACRPPGGNLDAVVAKLKKWNRARASEGGAPLLHPVEACRPRVFHELAGMPNIVPLGHPAALAVIPGYRSGLMKRRGNLVQVDYSDPDDPRAVPGRRILPSLDLGMVLRKGRWEVVFQQDIARALRWFQGALRWVAPGMAFKPDPAYLEELLFRHHYDWRGLKLHLYDVETDSIHARTANLRCIGIGTPDWAVVVPYQPVQSRAGSYTGRQGQSIPFYTPDERRAVDMLIRRWALDTSIVKAGHNAGSYDRIVMERQMGVAPTPLLDSLLMHRLVQPELPHRLDFLGSFYTDVHSWKGDVAVNAKTDGELWHYNGLDVTVNARVFEPVWAELEQRQQVGVAMTDHKIQGVCVGMHYTGMRVDQTERARLEKELIQEIRTWQFRVRAILHETGTPLDKVCNPAAVKKLRRAIQRGEDDAETFGLSRQEAGEGEWAFAGLDLDLDERAFNPGSADQLRTLLFDVWDLPAPSDMKAKELYTLAGEYSTGDAILRRLIMDSSIDPMRKLLIRALRKYRAAAKIYGTYVKPARMPIGDEKADRGCITWPDGYIYPNWKPGPVTGRLASSPNVQNWQKWPINTRNMIIPPEGCAFVAADLDQLELRIAADRWGAQNYLQALAEGIDPHQMTMKAVFGDKLASFEGQPSAFGRKDYAPKSEYDQMRDLGKKVLYASQYGATTPTVHRLITEAEDKKTGTLIYDWLTLDDTAGLHENWKAGCPEYPAGWERELAMFAQHGFLTERIHGRRRDFSDQAGGRRANMSEIVNFPIQSEGAAVVNDMTLEIVDAIPFEKWGPHTGLVNQCHDQLTLAVPREQAAAVTGLLGEIMNKQYAHMQVKITSEADVGDRWGKV